MRSKKVICAVIAAAMDDNYGFCFLRWFTSSTAEASSKTSSSSSSTDSTTAVKTEEKTTRDLNAVADKLKDSLDDAVKGTMTKFDETRIERDDRR